jgi:hypothetical protein
LGKIAQYLEQVAQTFAQNDTVFINITFETLKYLKKGLEMAYLGTNVQKLSNQKVAKNFPILGVTSYFKNKCNGLSKIAKWNCPC